MSPVPPAPPLPLYAFIKSGLPRVFLECDGGDHFPEQTVLCICYTCDFFSLVYFSNVTEEMICPNKRLSAFVALMIFLLLCDSGIWHWRSFSRTKDSAHLSHLWIVCPFVFLGCDNQGNLCVEIWFDIGHKSRIYVASTFKRLNERIRWKLQWWCGGEGKVEAEEQPF